MQACIKPAFFHVEPGGGRRAVAAIVLMLGVAAAVTVPRAARPVTVPVASGPGRQHAAVPAIEALRAASGRHPGQ
jgi:hypothetical protein